MTHALTHFLNPQSVAIIGVSPNPSFINAILNNLLRWQYHKPIYPVNPNYPDHRGLAELSTHWRRATGGGSRGGVRTEPHDS